VNRFNGQHNKIIGRLLLAALISMSGSVLAQVQAQTQTTQGEQTWTVNFNDADVQEVIKFVAGATGKTIIIDPKVRGPIKVMNSRSLNAKELYEVFLASLDIYGFTAIESGNIVRIIANRDARNMPIPTENNIRTKDDLYITQVIPLKNTSAAKILAALRPLVPQYAHLTTYEPSNALIITDTRANAARINDLVVQLDKIGVTETDVIPLRYANSADVVAMLGQLEKPDPNRGMTTSPPVIVADKRINAVVISGDDMSRKRLKLLIEDLDRPQTNNSNLRVVYLRYAKAEEVAKVLTGMMQSLGTKPAEGAATSGGQPAVQSDEATNSILITADVDTMKNLLSIVDSLDIRRAQVLIEAIIVELQDSDGLELGIEWMYRDDKIGFGSNRNDGTLGAVGQAAIDASDKNADQDDQDAALLNLAGAVSQVPGQLFGIGRLGKKTDLLSIIKVLQTNGKSNLLSTPSLLTTDNTEASMLIGQQVPFKTGSYSAVGGTTGGTSGSISSPFNTINREDVGLKLEVTPHINDGEGVVMDIVQEVSSISPSGNTEDGLITNKREIKTQIMAADGQTVVLGGLIKDDVTTSQTRVPILGSIPVLGHLFRSQKSTKVKTNLLVFIRPTIIRDDKVLTGATAEKYRAIREEQVEQRREGRLFFDRAETPLIPKWDLRQPAETNTEAKTEASNAEE